MHAMIDSVIAFILNLAHNVENNKIVPKILTVKLLTFHCLETKMSAFRELGAIYQFYTTCQHPCIMKQETTRGPSVQ